jgi:hypothetical protein
MLAKGSVIGGEVIFGDGEAIDEVTVNVSM